MIIIPDRRTICDSLDRCNDNQRYLMMNTNIDVSGAAVVICATVLLIMFYGEPDLHDAMISALQCQSP